MAARIPPALQPPTRTPTVRQTKIIKQYGSLENYQRVLEVQKIEASNKEIVRINSELTKFNTGLSYTNYKSRYDALSEASKKQVTPASEILASPEYKQVQVEQRQLNDYKTWISKANINVRKHGWIPTTIPKSLKGTAYESQIQTMIRQGQIKEGQLREAEIATGIRHEQIRTDQKTALIQQEIIQPSITSATGQSTAPVFGPQQRPQYIIPQDILSPPTGLAPTTPVRGTTRTTTDFFGQQQIDVTTTDILTPTMGGQGTSLVTPVTSTEFSLIKPDYKPGVIQATLGAVTSIPFLGKGKGPLVLGDEPVYLPDAKSAERYTQLLEEQSFTGTTKAFKFVRDQQAQLKKDIGAYNKLQSKPSLTPAEIKRVDELYVRVTQGQRGTPFDQMFQATEQYAAQYPGQKIPIKFFPDLKPRTARRSVVGGTRFAEGATEMALWMGAGAVVGAGAKAAGINVKFGKGARVAGNILFAGIAGTAGVLEGRREYEARGNIGDSIAAGAGMTAGFLVGGYSSSIIGGTRRLGARGLRNIRTGRAFDIPKYRGPKGKKGQQQLVQTQESEWIYDNVKQRWVKKAEVLRQRLIDDAPLISTSQKLENTRILYRNIPDKSPAKMKEFQKLIEGLYGKDLYRDFAIQEGLIIGTVTPKPERVATITTRPQLETPSQTTQSSRSSQATQSSVFAGTGQYERTGVTARGLFGAARSKLAAGTITTSLWDFGRASASATEVLTDQQPDIRSIVITDFDTSPDTAQDTSQDTISSPRSRTRQRTETTPTTTPALTPRITPALTPGIGPRIPRRPETPRRPTDPIKPIKPVGGFLFPGERPQSQTVGQVGYHAEVKTGGKYRRVTDNLYTRQGAMDVGARITDNTLAADFRIVAVPIERQAPKKKEGVLSSVFGQGNGGGFQPPVQLRSGDNYFSIYKDKFRDHKIKGKKRTKMKNQWIEKKQFRTDTRGETSKLTVAQFQARTSKRARGLPVRRTKGKRGFRL